jgi:hypothetical protein
MNTGKRWNIEVRIISYCDNEKDGLAVEISFLVAQSESTRLLLRLRLIRAEDGENVIDTNCRSHRAFARNF